ncbi:N-methylhydantoinase A/oxoprolinase/acetone carboxylase beta subunit [Bradyrhizobium sp. GM5.1]
MDGGVPLRAANPYSGGAVRPQDGPAEIEARFVKSYGDLYGHTHPDEPGILEACRVSVFGTLPKLVLPDWPDGGTRDPTPARVGSRPAYLGRHLEAPVYWFDRLRPGMVVPGPALVDSASTSVLILEGSHATLDRTGSLTITARREDDPTP